MVNPKHFQLPREQLEAKLKWYENKYGSSIGNDRGIHNWKNLFKKPTLQDWIILFMLIMMLFVAFAYNKDIQACKDFYDENLCELCGQSLSGDEPSWFGEDFIKEASMESGET